MAQDTVKKPENPENEIKKLLNAHMLVLKDKLGRAPTTDEIAEALKGEQTQSGQPVQQAIEETPENTTEPKILKLKVYYGQGTKKTDKGDVKAPDPNKILFYEGHDGKVFDCSSQSWIAQRPPVLDHLPVRPLLHDSKNSDIVQAILNGVLDDQDFDDLDKSGTINENTRKIYNLQKKAADIQQQLEKSQEIEIEEENAEEGSDETVAEIENSVSPEKVQTGINVVRNYMDTAGVQYGLDVVKEEFGEQGADLFTQILQAALADVDEKTRMMVREEMDACLAPVCDAIQLLAAHIGINIDLNEEEPETVPETEYEEQEETDNYNDPMPANEDDNDLTDEDGF